MYTKMLYQKPNLHSGTGYYTTELSVVAYVVSTFCKLILFALRKTFVFVRFEVSTAVNMTNGVFWDVTPRGSCKNRRFGGT
jgi:hypothetical protein